MSAKVLLTAAAAFMLAGAAVPATDMHLGRVAGSADAVSSTLTFGPTNPTVSVRVSNTSGKPGRVVGWLGDRSATAVAPAHSSIVKLTWDQPVMAGAEPGVLRLELYPEGDTDQPMDTEEHPYAVGSGYNEQPKPNNPQPEQPKPEQPKQSPSPSPAAALPVTGAQTSTLAMIGGGTLLFGVFALGVAWMLRRRHLRDHLS